MRTTGLGLVTAAERFGSILVGFVNARLLRIRPWAPLLPGAATMALAAVVVLTMLPRETSGRALDGDGDDDDGGGAGTEEAGDGVPLLPLRQQPPVAA